MRRILVAAVAVLGLAAVCGSAAEPQYGRVRFETNLYGSFQKAMKANKPLAVFFYQSECDNCKGACKHCAKLEKALNGELAARYADEAVFVKVDILRDDQHKNVSRLMEQLNVKQVPMLIVLDASPKELKEIGRIVGAFPEEEVARRLGAILTPARGGDRR